MEGLSDLLRLALDNLGAPCYSTPLCYAAKSASFFLDVR